MKWNLTASMYYEGKQEVFTAGEHALAKGLTVTLEHREIEAGADFLLAAWREEDTLHGMELLGNTAAAPGILRALGCTTGKFQIPGQEKAFAMIHKLQKNAATPKYFGLAFE